jgi:hypothetical protein
MYSCVCVCVCVPIMWSLLEIKYEVEVILKWEIRPYTKISISLLNMQPASCCQTACHLSSCCTAWSDVPVTYDDFTFISLISANNSVHIHICLNKDRAWHCTNSQLAKIKVLCRTYGFHSTSMKMTIFWVSDEVVW